MNILLTGATGFLGSHLLKRLLQEGHKVAILKRSSSNCRRIMESLDQCRSYDTDHISLDAVFHESGIGAVIHCATEYGKNIPADRVAESNLIFPLQVLEATVSANCPYFINTDSFFTKQLPDRLLQSQALYSPEYTLSKYQFREWGRLRAIEGEVNFINLQMEHIYGPDDGEGKFVPFLIRAMQNGTRELDLTDGIQIRDFIYVDDAAAAYLAVLADRKSLSGYSHFEVGTGVSYTVKELAETVRTELGAETRLNFGRKPRMDSEIMFSTARNRTSIAGFVPRITLEEGIKRMAAYLKGMEQE